MITAEDDKRDHPIPQTALEFEDYFKKSENMNTNLEDIRSYKEAHVDKPDKTAAYKESVKAEHARHTRGTSPYTISIPMQVRIVMLRRIQITPGFNIADFLIDLTMQASAVPRTRGTPSIDISPPSDDLTNLGDEERGLPIKPHAVPLSVRSLLSNNPDNDTELQPT